MECHQKTTSSPAAPQTMCRCSAAISLKAPGPSCLPLENRTAPSGHGRMLFAPHWSRLPDGVGQCAGTVWAARRRLQTKKLVIGIPSGSSCQCGFRQWLRAKSMWPGPGAVSSGGPLIGGGHGPEP
eukprot:4769677-Amphidinium_carterae.1